jgi:hypothetical protein
MAKKSNGRHGDVTETKRKYLSQADVPALGLEQALRVAQALAENYAKSPTKPLRVAEAVGMQPLSSRFRMLSGASIAYGLTDGGYNSEQIALTPLGRRIVAPTKEGDDFAAKREALLRPRVVRDFLTRYNGSRLPNAQIGGNVLEELGVPSDRSEEVYNFVVESARSVGFLRDLKGQMYVDLESAAPATAPGDDAADGEREEHSPTPPPDTPSGSPAKDRPDTLAPIGAARTNSRVFITHGRNMEIVAQLKEVLTFGGFTPVVALENETVSKPVPDKVMDDMRSCAAAIIHVGSESRYMDADGKEHKLLNQNVLIEIGAAMALYGRKFIMLVEQGATLPSNLQGLYEVRYTGTKLDYDATMKLLKAFNDFRS